MSRRTAQELRMYSNADRRDSLVELAAELWSVSFGDAHGSLIEVAGRLFGKRMLTELTDHEDSDLKFFIRERDLSFHPHRPGREANMLVIRTFLYQGERGGFVVRATDGLFLGNDAGRSIFVPDLQDDRVMIADTPAEAREWIGASMGMCEVIVVKIEER
jgi:hypothetical protein